MENKSVGDIPQNNQGSYSSDNFGAGQRIDPIYSNHDSDLAEVDEVLNLETEHLFAK